MRRVLVTGGGSGIGRAVARAFAEGGDAVTICGRRAEALEETAAGVGMDCRLADVTDEAQVAALFETPFEVVVANAGGGKSAKLVDTTLEDWNRTLAVTLTGTFLTFRAALPGMTAGGRLIAIGSTASLQGGPNIAAYVAAKHGVLGLVRSVAKEVAKKGITCNAVCPGFVDTPLADAAVQGVMDRFGIDSDAAVKKVVSGNPVGRMIDVQEVASAVLFLASPGAAMVNGHALSVSGGEMTAGTATEPLSKARLRLWLKLLKVTGGLEAEVRRRLREEFGSTLPRFDVLSALFRHPDGLKMSEISGLLRVSNGNVTGIVERLVEDGLARRVAVPGDRRAQRVRLTPKGRETFAGHAATHEAWIDELLAGADPATIAAMTRALDHLTLPERAN